MSARYRRPVPELERLRAAHASAVLDFELENRVYFASMISDRGDGFFERFDEELEAQLVSQEEGTCRFHVLVDDDGRVLGRFNLFEIGCGEAVVGYRVAARVAGRGVATIGVTELCGVAVTLGLSRLRAATSHENLASQRVLAKCGFTPVRPAAPGELGGREGTWFRRTLALASS
jgi:[ribosomal protein S5]-alanine N-acetyltransferase